MRSNRTGDEATKKEGLLTLKKTHYHYSLLKAMSFLENTIPPGWSKPLDPQILAKLGFYHSKTNKH